MLSEADAVQVTDSERGLVPPKSIPRTTLTVTSRDIHKSLPYRPFNGYSHADREPRASAAATSPSRRLALSAWSLRLVTISVACLIIWLSAGLGPGLAGLAVGPGFARVVRFVLLAFRRGMQVLVPAR